MSKKAFPDELTISEREEILLFLKERFGFPRELFDDYIFFKSATNYWMFPKTEHLTQIKKLTPEVLGLLFLRRVSQYLKPTSTFLQRFGRFATRNIVTLNKEMLTRLKEEKKIEIELPFSPGYVIIKDEDWFLGCGLYISGKLFAYFEEKVLHNLLH
ncbi:MAG: hypothetical protein ACK40E_05970 [Caldimicrobium sp.]